MTLRHMRILCALFENDCNTTKTAAALNMTQPAVSQAIHEMEDFYGTKLFERIGRRLSVTDAGRALLRKAKHISSLFDDAERELREIDARGKISVGATLTIGALFLPKFAAEYTEENPGTEIRSLVAPTNVLEQKVLSYELDFALIEGIAHDPDLVIEDFMDDELCVVAAPGGKYSPEQIISTEEFKNEKILVREASSGTREVFDHATEKAGFRIEPLWESFSTTAIIHAAICGLGIAVIPFRMAYPYIDYGALIRIRVEGLDLRRKFFLIRHREKQLSASAREFLEFCNNHDSELPVPVYVK